MTNNFKPQANQQDKPKMTKEEFAKIKQQEKENLYKLIDETMNYVVCNDDNFRGYLDTQSTMDRYSIANVLLIYNQLPQASKLKDFSDWSKENVKIKKGVKSISILEPIEYAKKDGTTGISYNVKKVFDISQTNKEISTNYNINLNAKDIAKAMLTSGVVDVKIVDDINKDNAVVHYDHQEKTIFVNKQINYDDKLLQSIAKELALSQLANDLRKPYNKTEFDFKANCIAYMLCKKYGIDNSSINIKDISSYFEKLKPKQIRNELTQIKNSMSQIHNRINDKFYQKSKERSKGYER